MRAKFLVVVMFFIKFRIYLTSAELCYKMINCQCVEHAEEINNGNKTDGIRVECSGISGAILHQNLGNFHERSKKVIFDLQVRDSELSDLRGLPSGLWEIRHMLLDNTNIDLEDVRESNELLVALKSLRVYNENFTEVPENFFQGMNELTILELNKVGIAALSEDSFRDVEDSLKELRLRENKFQSIPIAVTFLNALITLDLTDNNITQIPDNLADILETSLKSLDKLLLNRINCSCEFGKTEFVSWIRSHAIKGVTCYEPKRLRSKDVSITPTEDFCNSASHVNLQSKIFFSLIVLLLFKF